MKHKKAVLAAIALIAAGLVTAFAALAAIDFDLNKINTLRFVTNTHSVNETFTNISIKSAECDVRFLPSKDNTCQVVCAESEQIFHSVTVKDNTLIIDRTDARKWYEHIGVYWGNMEILVYLPQTEYETLRLLTVSGDIVIPEDFSFGEANIQSTSGDIDFLAQTKQDLSLETVSGNLRAAGSNPKNLDIHSTSGDINCSELIVSGDVTLKTVSGDIKLQDCDAVSLRLKSTSGDVSGTLLSGKNFIAETTSGDVDVPESSSGGKCEIETTSGDIEITVK